ncbi:MAG: restriction endonuclease subunit S [Treponema sp.]
MENGKVKGKSGKMTTKNTPQIRFKGFDDEWEEKKLGDVSERITRKNENLESTLPLTISAQYGLVDQVSFFNNQVASTANFKNYVLVKNGEFAYNKSYSSGYPWGCIKRLDRYEQGVLSTLYIVFKPIHINSAYLVFYYDADKWYKQISEIAAEGARNHGLLNISPVDFFQTTLNAPRSNAEQQKIGTFLSKIDSLIQLKTKKLESIKNVKKSLLQKCFPKDGEKVPQMRFKGFIGDWEEKKLGEIAELFDYGLNASATTFDGINKYLRITDIDDESRYFKTDDLSSPNCDLSNSESYLLNEGDIVFARTGASVGKTYIYNKKDGVVYFAGFLIRTRVKSEYDTRFIYQNTFSMKYNKYIQNTSQRSGQPGVNSKEYKEFTFMCPSSKSEQQKIGQFFSKYDSLISLQQKEIDKLKTIKKSLLQRMFV